MGLVAVPSFLIARQKVPHLWISVGESPARASEHSQGLARFAPTPGRDTRRRQPGKGCAKSSHTRCLRSSYRADFQNNPPIRGKRLRRNPGLCYGTPLGFLLPFAPSSWLTASQKIVWKMGMDQAGGDSIPISAVTTGYFPVKQEVQNDRPCGSLMEASSPGWLR